MRSPFIQLTLADGDAKISVNINNICHVEDQTYSNSKTRITYISLNSPGRTTVHVKENYEHVISLINEYYQ